MISNKKLKDFDLNGVPNDFGLYENRESTGLSIPEEHCGELQPASALLPTDCFMPIKALNQFSTDWVIKARIIKMGQVRDWKSDKGEG